MDGCRLLQALLTERLPPWPRRTAIPGKFLEYPSADCTWTARDVPEFTAHINENHAGASGRERRNHHAPREHRCGLRLVVHELDRGIGRRD